MDTSTPVSKQKLHILRDGLRRKALERDCERNSNVSHSNVPKSPEEDAELVYSQPQNDTRLDRSEELFPFSPIPYRKEVPSTLLPLLDTPDVKWSSSLFTSFHAQSENTSPEVLSEDNFVRTICLDSHGDSNAKYTTNSYFNSQVPGFSQDTNNSNVPPPDSYVERNSNRPSPPIISKSSRKKEKKFSSVTKQLFPFGAANDEGSQEQTPSLECGAMGDMTLNAVEKICMDSEIMYSKNSSKKSNTTNTFVDEATSRFIQDLSLELDENEVVQRESKRNFIYPCENVKKPVAPVLVSDILKTVLSLETNEISTQVPRKNFCQGLVCFSQLEPSSSQRVENSTFSLPVNVWCEADIENYNRTPATYEIVRVIYLPVFFCSSEEMSASDRDMLTVLKRYLECHRVHFVQSISKRRTRARLDLLSTFVDCSRPKFPKLNFSAAIIDSFFEFFILHPDLMYNYRLSRRFCVPSNQTTKKRRRQPREIQLINSLPKSLPSVEPSSHEVSLSSMTLDQKSASASPIKCDVSSEIPLGQKVDKMEVDETEINVSVSVALNQNPFVSDKHSVSNVPVTNSEMQVSCRNSEPKITDEQFGEKNPDCTIERQLPQESTLASYKKMMLELGAAFILASEKYTSIDDDVVERAKKLLEDVAAGPTRASKKAEKLNLVNSPAANTLDKVSEKSDVPKVSEKSDVHNQNSTDLISKTPFDVDIDSADLMFICDLSEKTVFSEKSLDSSDAFSRKSLIFTEKSPNKLLKNSSALEQSCLVSAETKVTVEPPIGDQMKNSNFTAASTGLSAKNHYSPSLGLKSTPVMKTSIEKCTSESGNSVIPPQNPRLQVQTMVLDDIENWNPELAVMMTPVEIKKQLIHTRSNKKDIGSSSTNSEVISASTNKFGFDAFNTAGGRKINVRPNSLVRAKKSMDAVQVEPEMMEEQFSNRRSTSGASEPKKLNPIAPHVDDVSKNCITTEKSCGRRLSEAANSSKSVGNGLLPQFSACERTTASSSRENSRTRIKFTSDESLNQMLKPLNAGSGVNQFSAFSTASGKKMSVSEKYLATGLKIFESTAEDKSIDELKPTRQDSSRFPLGDSNLSGKMKSGEMKSVTAPIPTEPSVFKKPTATLNKSETESHQWGGFCSVAGKKLTVSENSRKGAEKLYASVLNEVSVESAPDQQFASFSSASGKKIRVNDSLLAKGKKLYASTLEETKPGDPEITEKIANFSKPTAAKITKKVNVTEESLQRAQKLFGDCFDKDSTDKFILNPVDLSSNPSLSTFTSAAGKTIKVTEKKLLNARKILESVSAETELSAEEMGNSADDFRPCQSKIPSNSNASGAIKATVCQQRLKRSFNEDTLQNVPSCSFSASKKTKTDENLQNGVKSQEIVGELKSYEEILQSPSNYGVDYKSESVLSARTEEEKDSAAFVSEPPIDLNLLVDSFSVYSGEKETCQKSLDDTVLLNSDEILSDTDMKANCDLPATESAAAVESTATSLDLSQEISESTSAFLFDMKNDNLGFDPSLSSGGAVDESEAKTATPEISRSSSPVFDSCKQSHRKRYKKRRSQHSLNANPLEVTYVRKESDSAAGKSTPEEVLKMLNQNFAQKVNKRKEPASNMVFPSSKKAKDSNEHTQEQRKQAALDQQKLVSQKDEGLCKPRVGSILEEKLCGSRKSLREMVNNAKPQRYSVSRLLQLGLKRSVVNVNADNAKDFIFTADFLSAEGAKYGDECTVIPNEKNEVCFEDLARAFLASPGVDPRLISLPWIRNHYRWIIWKLASTERSYPNIFGGKYLTLTNVLLQLKFRYDWEVDRCCRSALKRILECDSSPSETMILCVASIKTIVASLSEYEIEMTDGWYSIPCLFDGEMLKLLTQKKIAVGTKLVIMNAELTGAGEGCDPLQANQSARLKVATNSVRRARWYAPLGFYCGKPIVVSDLLAILPNGGIVPQFSAVIARVYPMLYLEKRDDGSFTLHNEKVHFKKMADFEKRRQMCLESLVSQITSEVEKENPSMDSDSRSTDSDSDPIAYQNRRYHEQERLQSLIQERVKQKLPEEFKAPKRASSMLKVRLINKDARGDPVPAALLTIWHPPEDLVSLLSEGKLYEFHKIVAGGLRNGQIQLTANRLTKYKHVAAGDMLSYGRQFTSFSELNTDFKAAFGEVDVVGLVISGGEIESDVKNDSLQTIYLADLNKNLMIVKFRVNVKDFGFDNTLKLQNVIAGLNLQWKRSLCNGQIPIVFASELTSFVHSSRCQHLQKCMDKFHSYFKNKSLNDYVAECKEKLKNILSSAGPIATSTPERSNPRPSTATENSVASEPTNEASLNQNNSADSSDASCNAKSKSAYSRIEKLRGYGEPPALSPISMCSRRRSSRLSIQSRVHKLSINKN